jgi:hypothetical protein
MLLLGRLSRQLCFAHDFETWQANSLSCSTMNEFDFTILSASSYYLRWQG